MAWGYQIWNNNGDKILDTSDSIFPSQSYPTINNITSTTTITYDLLGIGTSSVNFHYSPRIVPSGTTRRELIFTTPMIEESTTFTTNLPTTLDQVTTFTMYKPSSVIIDSDVSNWQNDVSFRAILILLPFLV